MFSHIMVGTNDIDRAKKFYDAVLTTLGPVEIKSDVTDTGHRRIFYQYLDNTFCVTEPINGDQATSANGSTIAFKCRSPAMVDDFFHTALKQGGEAIENPPGRRDNNFGTFYTAYILDRDGNKLCAICRYKDQHGNSR